MTMLWFIVWLIWNVVGDTESLTFDPVNFWAGSLLFALAVDLGRQHTADLSPSRGKPAER